MPRLQFLLLFFFSAVNTLFAQPAVKKESSITASFDSILQKEFKPSEPGATVIVVRKGKQIYQKAIGLADMELNVPLQPDMIFRIGSISKQFTAVAILQLADQGKISLQDNIKKYMPDLPFKDTVTIEQLLHHTSGIKSYTNKPDFPGKMRTDMSPMEVIQLTDKDPLEFKPGTEWNYNNTGYVMLGYIIEKVSGKTYADYVQQYLFTPADMRNSYYGNESTIIPKRVKGYQKKENQLQHSDFISMTLPYAAGSLLSTVEDLWKWNIALYSYKLIKKEWVDKAITPYILPDGKSTGYGYGLSTTNVQGSKAIEHGGGIPGFLTNAIYLPKEEVFVAMFSNCECKSPTDISAKLAAIAIGKPYQLKAIPITEYEAKQYEAVYNNANGEERIIRWEDGKLTSQRGSSTPLVLHAFAKDHFFFDNSLTTLAFKRSATGAVEGISYQSRDETIDWTKTNKTLPAPVSFIKVDAKILSAYTGDYELAANFILTIILEGEQLFAQATGQPRFELQAVSTTRFKTKGLAADIEFKNGTDGKTESLTLFQGGREMVAKKK